MAKVPTDMYEKPRIHIHIFDCGQLGHNGLPIVNGKTLEEEIEEESNNAVNEYEKARAAKEKRKLLEKQSKAPKEERKGSDEEPEEAEEDEDEKEIEKLKNQTNTDKIQQKRLELMMKMNEARKMNCKAVIEEQERLTDPMYEKRKNKDELFKDKKQQNALGKDKAYLLDSVALADKSKKRKGNNLTFGWDVFNEDSLYRGYYKRVRKNLENDQEGQEE